jgi:hypothetical protein
MSSAIFCGQLFGGKYFSLRDEQLRLESGNHDRAFALWLRRYAPSAECFAEDRTRRLSEIFIAAFLEHFPE